MQTIDHETLFAQVSAELQGKTQPMDVQIQPITVLQLAGLMQLAMRHPEISTEARACADSFLVATRQYFADCPAVLETLRRGDDPSADLFVL